MTQLVVCSNGLCGASFEHSMIDGSTAGQLNKAIAQAILTDLPTVTGDEIPATYSHLQFDIDDKIAREVQRVHHLHDGNALKFRCEAQELILPGLGNEFFRQYGCSGKTGLQLTIQLASRFAYGTEQPPCWETVTMRRFQGGRVDIVQTVQPRVKEWCEVASSEYSDVFSKSPTGIAEHAGSGKCKELFQAAAREHGNNISRVAKGHGFAGHLYALQEMRKGSASTMSTSVGATPSHPDPSSLDEDCPMLFRPGSTFWRTRPRRLMTDSSSWLFLEGLENQCGYTQPFEENIYLHYNAQDDQ